MRRNQHRFHRVLTLDPTHRGFGYAILELPDNLLIDWGVCQVRTEKREHALRRVAGLIHRFAPNLVIVEDTGHPRCRRRGQSRAMIAAIAALARTMDVAVGRVSMARVRQHYAELGAKNKDAIAKAIVERFPELRSFLPPPRRVWMPEDERMAVFDAMAFALTMVLVSVPR